MPIEWQVDIDATERAFNQSAQVGAYVAGVWAPGSLVPTGPGDTACDVVELSPTHARTLRWRWSVLAPMKLPPKIEATMPDDNQSFMVVSMGYSPDQAEARRQAMLAMVQALAARRKTKPMARWLKKRLKALMKDVRQWLCAVREDTACQPGSS